MQVPHGSTPSNHSFSLPQMPLNLNILGKPGTSYSGRILMLIDETISAMSYAAVSSISFPMPRHCHHTVSYPPVYHLSTSTHASYITATRSATPQCTSSPRLDPQARVPQKSTAIPAPSVDIAAIRQVYARLVLLLFSLAPSDKKNKTQIYVFTVCCHLSLP